MADWALKDRRVLVVEDEYMLMDELCSRLQVAGAIVVGPAGNLADTMSLLASGVQLDAAILDVNLRGEMVFAAADTLGERGVPFVFATGYDGGALPTRFAATVCCEKPVDLGKVAKALHGA